jgi:hypothetical protein
MRVCVWSHTLSQDCSYSPAIVLSRRICLYQLLSRCLRRPFLSASSLFLLIAATQVAPAQDNFISRWQARATATLAQQPKWAPPVVSPYPQLIQVIRADFYRTISPTHVTTWNYGDGRGINLIPLKNSEVDIFYPDYFQHSNGTVDGFGDLAFSGKYRFLSQPEKRGNYVVSAFINATVPTGDHKNGAAHPTIAPNVGAGKGFGKFNVTSCFGATIPTEQADTLGRTITFNTNAQYHAEKMLWLEVEDNASFFNAGPNDGKKQNFITPGVLGGPFKFHPADPGRREALTIGAAIQIATSSFHATNHNVNFTARYTF